MEGVMMRGRTSVAVAIRRLDESIYLHEEALNPRLYQNRLFRLPFLRGLLLLWEMLVLGTRLMTFSANVSTGALNPDAPTTQAGTSDTPSPIAKEKSTAEQLEPPPQIGGTTMGVTLLIFFTFAVLFFLLGSPFLAKLLRNQIGDGWLHLVFLGAVR